MLWETLYVTKHLETMVLQAFWSKLKTLLLLFYKTSLLFRVLSEAFLKYKQLLSLLRKKTDKRLIKNWRPTSPLNIDV